MARTLVEGTLQAGSVALESHMAAEIIWSVSQVAKTSDFLSEDASSILAQTIDR